MKKIRNFKLMMMVALMAAVCVTMMSCGDTKGGYFDDDEDRPSVNVEPYIYGTWTTDRDNLEITLNPDKSFVLSFRYVPEEGQFTIQTFNVKEKGYYADISLYENGKKVYIISVYKYDNDKMGAYTSLVGYYKDGVNSQHQFNYHDLHFRKKN